MLIRKNHTLTIALLCVAGLAAATGCSRKVDDNQLAQSIQSQIQKDAAVNGQVSVQSGDGVVTLNGQVPNDAARALAAREAADTPGVRQVINNLVVQTAPAEAAAAPPPQAAHHGRAHHRVAEARHEVATAANEPPPEPAAAIAPTNPPPPAPAAPVEPPPEETAAPPLPPPPAPVKHTIPAGTTITVRLIDSLDSARNRPGDTFRATLNSPIRLDGEVVVPFGADVEGRVVDAANAGRFTGHSELKLELTKLVSHGHAYALNTENFDRSTAGRGKGTAEAAGGGAVLGAIIGALAGGGKGAAIGTIAGAGAGGGARGARKGKRITFPSESVLSFRLQDPVTVVTMDESESRPRQ
jgi:BON domain